MIKDFLNPERHHHFISGSKVTAILLKGWILPICGVAFGRVCACSLHSRLVLMDIVMSLTKYFCILSFTLHCCKFGIVKNDSLFEVSLSSNVDSSTNIFFPNSGCQYCQYCPYCKYCQYCQYCPYCKYCQNCHYCHYSPGHPNLQGSLGTQFSDQV